MAIQKERVIQSITAYRCRICKKYHSEDLLVKEEENEVPLEIESILRPFFDYMKKCKIDKYTSRAILLAHEAERKELGGSIVRLHICPDAGKALENFSVVNHRKNTVQGYRGDNHSAVYAHNVLIYLSVSSNVTI